MGAPHPQEKLFTETLERTVPSPVMLVDFSLTGAISASSNFLALRKGEKGLQRESVTGNISPSKTGKNSPTHPNEISRNLTASNYMEGEIVRVAGRDHPGQNSVVQAREEESSRP